jgi:ligand-binding sensor domain-containing protein
MKLGVLFICLFLFNNLFAQELTFLRYTNKNGLPSNEVFGMAIDRKGYLWICTDKGISKFDGSNFKTYTSLDGLKDNVFFKITHDYKDRIWLWSFNQNYNYISEGKIYTFSEYCEINRK